MTDLARRQRIGDVNDAQAAAKPDRMHEGPGYTFAELMRAETRAAHPAEWRIKLAHLKLRQRPDGREVADIECKHAGVRAPAPRLLFACALRLVLLINGQGNAPAADLSRHRHDRVRRLGKQRVVIEAACGLLS